MNKKLIKISWFDVLAIVIAGIALIYSFFQGQAQIRHNHISVEPRVNSYFSNDGTKNQWGIYIINNGMGTAFVKSLDVFVDGKKVPNHENGTFYSAAIALQLNPDCFSIGGPRENDSLQVGEEILLIEGHHESELIIPENCIVDKLKLMEQHKKRLDYTLKIESIYGDQFEYTYSKNKQTNLE